MNARISTGHFEPDFHYFSKTKIFHDSQLKQYAADESTTDWRMQRTVDVMVKQTNIIGMKNSDDKTTIISGLKALAYNVFTNNNHSTTELVYFNGGSYSENVENKDSFSELQVDFVPIFPYEIHEVKYFNGGLFVTKLGGLIAFV